MSCIPSATERFRFAVMNHGVSLNAHERSFFPLVEFRDAAMWFARRGYLVVAPFAKVRRRRHFSRTSMNEAPQALNKSGRYPLDRLHQRLCQERLG
jgi:hypothetical protein